MTSKIVVIGAGSAGIAAATRAIELGFKNVQILEASNRIGGRIHTIPFGANVIDLGAQWCHGENDNVVFEHMSRQPQFSFGSTGDRYETFHCIRSNKEIVDEKLATRLYLLISKYLKNSPEQMKTFDGSLGEFLSKGYYDSLKTTEYMDIDEAIAKEFFECYLKYENSIEGSDSLFEVSAKGLSHYKECEGDKVLSWKDLGFITFLHSLIKSTAEKKYGVLENKIIFNTKVNEIKWSTKSTEKIMLSCSNDVIIEADHVICTVSLGVLKHEHLKLFQPLLPSEKIEAIDGLGFGTVNKLFLEFPNKFWDENWEGFVLFWQEDELIKIRNGNNKWIEDVFGFFTVDYQPNVLCGWITGDNSRKIEELTDENVMENCLFLLRKFLSCDVPTPVNFKRSAWYSDKNTYGSYSFRSVKTDELNTSADKLSEPILNEYDMPIIQFAGEATHNCYYSTVHGATESGWREVNRLHEFYIKKQSHL